MAKEMGARLHPNSGAGHIKSDASLKEEHFRFEMKSTKTLTLPFHIGWLAKIAAEALVAGQRPGVVVSFVDGDGKPRMRRHSEWVMIPREVFKELLGD